MSGLGFKQIVQLFSNVGKTVHYVGVKMHFFHFHNMGFFGGCCGRWVLLNCFLFNTNWKSIQSTRSLCCPISNHTYTHLQTHTPSCFTAHKTHTHTHTHTHAVDSFWSTGCFRSVCTMSDLALLHFSLFKSQAYLQYMKLKYWMGLM